MKPKRKMINGVPRTVLDQPPKFERISTLSERIVDSIFLHGIPILALILLTHAFHGDGLSQHHGDPRNIKVSIIPKSVEAFQIKSLQLPVDKPVSIHSYQKAVHRNAPCRNYYGGIGILMDWSDQTMELVKVVYEGYPAYYAGVKPGMRVSSPDGDIKGEVGTEVNVIIRDGNSERMVRMVRDKICLDVPEAKP
jgi:hypothetical protein